MTTVTGLTAARMLAIEAASIIDGEVDSSGNLILQSHDGNQINAGSVIGPEGPKGDTAGPPTRQILATPGSGTYTRPVDCVAILVEALGAGGSTGNIQTGSSNVSAAQPGGNGGWYVAKLILNPLSSYEYTVPGIASMTQSGAAAIFGTNLVVAPGGKYGAVALSSAASAFMREAQAIGNGNGGPAIGDLIIPGGQGRPGINWSLTQHKGGDGGDGAGPYGAQGLPGIYGGSGSVYGGYGAGAGGPSQGPYGGGTWNNPGFPGSGLIVVTEFY